eukprot:CAMPEP_0178390044 /NCGR_PEP_ID=MMETSP0689_2-20121128/10441_1 /TAXON_ID=160604 /ORGANISM="Amphidinium massartii, Strain CS-259" /LENGTH=369 /DNA_ID=CAMNT_0020010537 /DNA_START=164 /DNA_END=1273 /DNA_ORIENTATION=+
MSRPGYKRAASTREMEQKDRKQEEAITARVEAEEATKRKQDIEKIRLELENNPKKVKRALLLVCESNACLPKQEGPTTPPKEQPFSDHYELLVRMPVGFLHSKMLPKLVQNLDSATVKKLIEKDGKIDQKMLMATLVVSPSHPFAPRLPSELLHVYTRRAERRGKPCSDLCWSPDFVVDWQKFGLYRMQPELPAGASEAEQTQHKYTTVVFAKSITAALGEYGNLIDGSWVIVENHDFSSACIQKGDGTFSTPLKSFFANSREFAQMIEPEYTFEQEPPSTPTRAGGKAKAKAKAKAKSEGAGGRARGIKQVIRRQNSLYGSPSVRRGGSTPGSSSSSRAPAPAAPPPPSGRGEEVEQALAELDADENE